MAPPTRGVASGSCGASWSVLRLAASAPEAATAVGPLREVDDRCRATLDPDGERLGAGPEAQDDVGHPLVFLALEHLHEPLNHRASLPLVSSELSYICRQPTTRLSTSEESCEDLRSRGPAFHAGGTRAREGAVSKPRVIAVVNQ